MPVDRKLVAVVVADVAGYSRLMERDEAGTHERLRKLRAELIDPKIAEHRGRTVKTTGDGMLLEFPSATSALRCAVEIQRAMGVRNRGVASEDRIELRMGINLGDIIVEGDDIVGDGVNVAARLEALAEPGGVCVAASVWEQVHEDLGVEFVDAGDQYVKNISKPVHVYRVALEKGGARRPPAKSRVRRLAAYGGAALALVAAAIVAWQMLERSAPSTSAEAPPGSRQTLMVLPFRAAQPELGPLAATLTTETTRLLAAVLRYAPVVAPEVSAAAVAAGGDLRAIGERAGARYLVDGEIRSQGDEVVATVRLVDATLAKELGSTRTTVRREGPGVDHELLAKRVHLAARDLFFDATTTRGGAPLAPNATAQDMVDRARYLRSFGGISLASVAESRKLLDEAIRREPALADAWTARADLGIKWFSIDFVGADDQRILDEMERDSMQAVNLDSRSVGAWITRSWVLIFQGRFDAALEAIDQAQKLDPTVGWYARANALSNMGRAKDVLDLVASRDAMVGRRETLFTKMSCEAKLNLGDYRGAIEDCERASTSNDNPDIALYLAAAYAQVGDLDRARRAKDGLMRALPSFSVSRQMKKWSRNAPAWHEQQRDHVVPGLRKAGVPE